MGSGGASVPGHQVSIGSHRPISNIFSLLLSGQISECRCGYIYAKPTVMVCFFELIKNTKRSLFDCFVSNGTRTVCYVRINSAEIENNACFKCSILLLST